MVESRWKAREMTQNLLSIAGYDPSGGAGIGLDLRVFERLGFRGLGILTSVTAQNAARVEKVFHLPAGVILKQYETLVKEVRLTGIKVGMAGSLENLTVLARILSGNPSVPRVVDPVFRSSSGAPLLDKRALPRFLELLKGKATLITPNLKEASTLSRLRVNTVKDMREAARRIYKKSLIPCLVKGGHLERKAVDILYDGRDFAVFQHARVNKSVHGTGCFLSAAILGYLAGGCGLEEACRLGIGLTGRSIRKAVPAGQGRMVFSFPL
jgi:hydroxymethylpyrimidine/phosphomethylpyrimidine kinase